MKRVCHIQWKVMSLKVNDKLNIYFLYNLLSLLGYWCLGFGGSGMGMFISGTDNGLNYRLIHSNEIKIQSTFMWFTLPLQIQ